VIASWQKLAGKIHENPRNPLFSCAELVTLSRRGFFPFADYTHRKELLFMDWRHKAACLTEDPELFFPVGNTGPALVQIAEAKKVCRRCGVREACLQWALDAGQDHGVWGGLSEDERRAMKRRAARMRVRSA